MSVSMSKRSNLQKQLTTLFLPKKEETEYKVFRAVQEAVSRLRKLDLSKEEGKDKAKINFSTKKAEEPETFNSEVWEGRDL